jgi:hypothetical protein
MRHQFVQIRWHLKRERLRAQRAQLDEVIFRLFVLLLERSYNFLVYHRLSSVEFGFLLILLIQQAVSLEHELHLRLGLLQDLSKLRTHDVW